MRKIIAILILSHLSAHAELDQHSQKGLNDTKALLKDPIERQKAVNADPQAKEVDAKVNALAGNEKNKEEIYDLATRLMEKITLESNGDAAKMQALLMEAQKNPQAFYDKMFSKEEKARVRGVAEKVERRKPNIGPGD